jgi:HTH-type transcriptional regulator/antitoxin HipB
MAPFDLAGTVRRLRRVADLSQRELARALDVSKSSIGAAESGASGMDARVLARAAALAGLRLALLDADGREVAGMSADAVRDLGGRLFPAHLDTVHTDDLPGRYDHRCDRPRPSYAAGRDRAGRDARRRSHGTPEDHHPYRPGDSPHERRAARRRAALLRAGEERQRRLAAGDLPPVEDFECTCPPRCEELDDRSGPPVHADGCPCSCDVG